MAAADALSPRHDVTILGPQFATEPWPPLRLARQPVTPFLGNRGPGFLAKMPAIVRSIDSDVIVCCKVRFPSVGIARLARFSRHIPWVLLVDDDELALTAPGRRRALRRRLTDPGGDLYTRLAHRWARKAQAVVTTTSSMRAVYGGETLPLGRALTRFDPALYDRSATRHDIGLQPSEFVVGFIGIPREHKGVHDLVEAAESAGIPNLRVLVVPPAGMEGDELCTELARVSSHVRVLYGQPSERVPELLAACDAVVIPQRSTPAAEGQLPAKLLEAMAMGLAIVGTRVADIPSHLEGCGLVVAPSAPVEIADALRRLAGDADLRARLGRNARERYERSLSSAALAPSFTRIVEDAALGRPQQIGDARPNDQ
jgi:glycosyltransferase involved in cell wall biosynthesis